MKREFIIFIVQRIYYDPNVLIKTVVIHPYKIIEVKLLKILYKCV